MAGKMTGATLSPPAAGFKAEASVAGMVSPGRGPPYSRRATTLYRLCIPLQPCAPFRDDFPILLMADGRVFADFGRGFEQIVRSCALPIGYNSPQIVSPSGLQQPVAIQPTVTQPAPPGLERLPYTPPVPAQQTPSQQIVAQGGQLPQASLGNQSCWAMAQTGRIVVALP